MDDTRGSALASRHAAFRPVHSGRCSPAHRRRLLVLNLLVVLLTSQAGCSFFINTGRILFGDPVIPSAFRSQTGVNPAKTDKKLLVVCTTPHSIKSEYPAVDFELIDGITRRLKLHGVDMVPPDDVATWIDDNGGMWNDPSELARSFDADYIVHIDLKRFTLREENSPTLWRGRVDGTVFAYEVIDAGGQKSATTVFEREYKSEYPAHYPVSVDRKSLKIFRKEYVDHISDELARYFHDYRMSDQIP